MEEGGSVYLPLKFLQRRYGYVAGSCPGADSSLPSSEPFFGL
jgi:hypothetical protein